MGTRIKISGVPETKNQDTFKIVALPNKKRGLSVCTGNKPLVLKENQAIDLAIKILGEFPPKQKWIVGGEQFKEKK